MTSSAHAVATSFFRALLPTRRPVGTPSSLMRRGLKSETHKSIQRRRPCLTPRSIGTAGVVFDMHYAIKATVPSPRPYCLKT